jgi:hypothetical protein
MVGRDTNGGCTEVRPPLAFRKYPLLMTSELERGYGLTQAVRAERLDVVTAVER